MNLGIPIVILEGSDMANEIFAMKDEHDNNEENNQEFNTSLASKKEVINRLAASKFV